MLDRASGLRIVCPLVGLLVTDCATVLAQPTPGGPPPANYRQIVSDGDAASILRDEKPVKSDQNSGSDSAISKEESWALRMRLKGPVTLTVSSLRKTFATQQGDWFVCLKAVRGGSASYYGISFIGAEIVEWRPAVAIDHCEQQAYGPLPPPARKTKKNDSGEPDDKPSVPAGRRSR